MTSAACGGGVADPPGGTGSSTAGASHPSASPEGHGSGSSSRSPSPTPTAGKKRKRPFSFLTELFNITPLGNCTIDVAAGTSADSEELRRFSPVRVCVTGFPESAPPDLTVTTPSGRRESVDDVHRLLGGGAGWEWDFHTSITSGPATELGTYEYTFTSGDAEASGEFVVTPAAVPDVDLPSPVKPGADVTVELSGFDAHRRVLVSIYGPGRFQKEVELPLVDDLPDLRTDSHGEATVAWHARSDLAAGPYVIWADPRLICTDTDARCPVFIVGD